MEPLKVVIAVEDVPTREWIKRILPSLTEAMVMGEAENGKQLVEAIAQLEPDLLVVDIHLPGMDDLAVQAIGKAVGLKQHGTGIQRPWQAADRKLILRTEKMIHFIPLQDILFIEKVSRKSVVHTPSRSYESSETLGALLERLDERFLQSHRAYVINLDHISCITHSGDTHLVSFDRTDKQAYLSKQKWQDFLSRIQQEGAFSYRINRQ